MAGIVHQLLLAAPSIPRQPEEQRNHRLLAARRAWWERGDGRANAGFTTTPGASVRIRFRGDDADAVDLPCSRVLLGPKPSGLQIWTSQGNRPSGGGEETEGKEAARPQGCSVWVRAQEGSGLTWKTSQEWRAHHFSQDT